MSRTAAGSVFHGLATAKLLIAYARTRQKKGMLGADFVSRSLRFLAERVASPRARLQPPLITAAALTSRCPLRCHHCSAAHLGRGEPTREQLVRTIDEVVALGCPVVVMTGGEPLLSPHLLELLDRVPAARTAMIFSSGVGLTEEQARDFRARRNLLVSFSLDHSDPSEHDRRRGLQGAHAAVMRGLTLLRGGACEVHVSSLVTKDRIANGELESFARELKGRGVSCLQLFQPRPVGALEERSAVCLTPEEELEVWRMGNALNEEASAPLVLAYPAIEHSQMLGCCGGYARMYIDAEGHVCPCDFAPVSFGRVGAEPLAAAWERMHACFARPGSKCLARDFPGLFTAERLKSRASFASFAEASDVRSPTPAAFDRYGEPIYRLLLGSMALGAVAARERLAELEQKGELRS